MTAMRLLRPAEIRAMPWKNGGGVTREIASWPPRAPDFDWRVSVATIERDGPFSEWPGIDRTIAMIDGRIALDGPHGSLTLGPDDEPERLAGERPVSCRLAAGIARALNLMIRRGRSDGRLVRARGASNAIDDVAAVVCLGLEGRWRCRLDGTRSRLLESGEALVADARSAPISFLCEPETPAARAIIATRSAS